MSIKQANKLSQKGRCNMVNKVAEEVIILDRIRPVMGPPLPIAAKNNEIRSGYYLTILQRSSMLETFKGIPPRIVKWNSGSFR
ncbi:hypothetical protein NPIL_564471 [Nephila pilipes]|uniref:Uncharacterized protein n=1 Tax=Nephila pilipes TaxID=299642 RepID=A0A8X6U129_NEPPI|nr:hypothetical protein NPIL_564471 [Nephila pilipes]